MNDAPGIRRDAAEITIDAAGIIVDAAGIVADRQRSMRDSWLITIHLRRMTSDAGRCFSRTQRITGYRLSF
ncbi:hypothetical protein ACXR0O_04480 [Verrucomicrobiota bacterium sgz303538]